MITKDKLFCESVIELEKLCDEICNVKLIALKDGGVISSVDGCNLDFTKVKTENQAVDVVSFSYLSRMYKCENLQDMGEIYKNYFKSKTFNSSNKSIDKIKEDVLINLECIYDRIKDLIIFKGEKNGNN
jgi:hypothetical protein